MFVQPGNDFRESWTVAGIGSPTGPHERGDGRWGSRRDGGAIPILDHFYHHIDVGLVGVGCFACQHLFLCMWVSACESIGEGVSERTSHIMMPKE